MGGVSPADVTSLILHLELEKRQRAAELKRAEAKASGQGEQPGALARDEDGELAQA